MRLDALFTKLCTLLQSNQSYNSQTGRDHYAQGMCVKYQKFNIKFLWQGYIEREEEELKLVIVDFKFRCLL